MNIYKIRIFISLIILGLLSEFVMAGFFSKKVNEAEFSKMLKAAEDNPEKTIEDVEVNDIVFPVDEIKEIKFKNINWKNIDAHNKTLLNITFEDCKLENINFRQVKFNNLTFINCELINVVANESEFDKLVFINSKVKSTDSNVFNNWRNITTNSIEITDTEMEGINFFESKGHIKITNSNLEMTTGMGLEEGSSLEIYDSKINYMDFSGSYLEYLTIRNSFIEDSKVNQSYIKNIILEDNRFLGFSIGFLKDCDHVYADRNTNLAIGGKVRNTEINNCQGPLTDIAFSGNPFERAEFNNCHIIDFFAYRANGNEMILNNMDIGKFNINDSNIKTLILNNVNIRKKLYTKNAQVENYKPTNVTVKEGIKRKTGGENITIKTTP